MTKKLLIRPEVITVDNFLKMDLSKIRHDTPIDESCFKLVEKSRDDHIEKKENVIIREG